MISYPKGPPIGGHNDRFKELGQGIPELSTGIPANYSACPQLAGHKISLLTDGGYRHICVYFIVRHHDPQSGPLLGAHFSNQTGIIWKVCSHGVIFSGKCTLYFRAVSGFYHPSR